MPVHDELGKRMKAYEDESNKKLVKKLPVIIRIDGRAFHTFTRKLEKPFDDILIDTMHETMRYLCKHVAGCVLGYCQSDEISLLLQDYKNEETQPWFELRVPISRLFRRRVCNKHYSVAGDKPPLSSRCTRVRKGRCCLTGNPHAAQRLASRALTTE